MAHNIALQFEDGVALVNPCETTERVGVEPRNFLFEKFAPANEVAA